MHQTCSCDQINFMNEIASICEKTGADVEWVAHQEWGSISGSGSSFFSRRGIGYGGFLFPEGYKCTCPNRRACVA
ncbi:hypothetical protein ACEQPO_27035 [Bacillus sp. SL00103]